MSHVYLEVTNRHGRPFASYLYLPRRPGQKSLRTRRIEPGLVIDFARTGQAIGIEITAPERVSLTHLNRVLRDIGAAPLKRVDFAPLRAA